MKIAALLLAPLLFAPLVPAGDAPRDDPAPTGEAPALEFVPRGARGFLVDLAGAQAHVSLAGLEIGHVALRPLGASGALRGLDPFGYTVHRYVGEDPDAWIVGATPYARVLHESAWPGVDVLYRAGPDGLLEFDAIVAPGASPALVRFEVEGAQPHLEADGSLTLGPWRLAPPYAYQEPSSARVEIESRFEVAEDGTVGFRVGAYDTSRPLVIDPIVAHSTYVATTGNDATTGEIQRDADGGLLVVLHDGANVQVNKLASNARAYQWRTTIGGSLADVSTGFAAAPGGGVIVTGITDRAVFPTTAGVWKPSGTNFFGSTNSFVFRLRANGTLEWSTYVLGIGSERATDVAVGPDSSVYVGGWAYVGGFEPTLPGLYPTPPQGGNPQGFVLRLDGAATALVGGTYLGGNSHSEIHGIDVADDGSVVVGGWTNATNWPVKDAFQATMTGRYAAVYARLSANLDTLLAGSYFGGSGDTHLGDIDAGPDGQVALVGLSYSSNLPLTRPIQQDSGGIDGWLVVAQGSQKLIATYIGSGSNDGGTYDVENLADGTVVTASHMASSGFPLVNATLGHSGGGGDGLIAHVDPSNAALVMSTYFGGSGADDARGVLLEAHDIWILGSTVSTDLPARGPPQPSRPTQTSGYRDLYVGRLNTLGAPEGFGNRHGEIGMFPLQVELRWSEPSDTGGVPISSYKLYRQMGSATETLRATLPATARAHVDDWLDNPQNEPPTEARYRIAATTSVVSEGPSARLDCYLYLDDATSFIHCDPMT